ncbi:dihydrofolate reductase [Acaricomes phytoseiuli]|uniref:dihydrofolate reductase n=1 Tax=Acaricomes phytoseiuli TaxID=291968 RepID=UPI0003645DF2|nr:dihydrofolate reductase [Acaricomes phytoseiuli]MCW1249744.1 dihydrofolate reductase [Acaricomes phytoseiuli]
MTPRIGLIWAQTTQGVIGSEGGMPWHLPEDLAHFRRTTEGHPVIMGRRTWDSFPERFRPLPGRTNYVLTREPGWGVEADAAGAHVICDGKYDRALERAITVAKNAPGGEEIWIIGGGRVYQQALPLADSTAITYIDTDVSGDTLAPELGPEWELTRSDPAAGWHSSSTGTGYRFTWWQRRQESSRAESGSE